MPARLDAIAIREALAAYYRSTYGCFRSEGEPCGPERVKTSDGNSFRSVSLPPVGPRYGERRRVVFVGMNPGRHEVGEEGFSSYFTEGNPDGWHMVDIRRALRRISGIALGESAPRSDDVSPFVSWINLVKCASTTEPNGNPSRRMWIACGPNVWPELEILAPDVVVALGSDVHGRIVEGAAHRGAGVVVPASPWDEYWAEAVIAGKRIGVFAAVHPNGMRTANGDWKALRDGCEPNNARLVAFLRAVTGSTNPQTWRDQVLAGSSDEGNRLVEYIERLFLAPGAQPPPRLPQMNRRGT